MNDVALFCIFRSRQVTSKTLLALYNVLRMRALQLRSDEEMKKRMLPVSDSQLMLALKVGADRTVRYMRIRTSSYQLVVMENKEQEVTCIQAALPCIPASAEGTVHVLWSHNGLTVMFHPLPPFLCCNCRMYSTSGSGQEASTVALVP